VLRLSRRHHDCAVDMALSPRQRKIVAQLDSFFLCCGAFFISFWRDHELRRLLQSLGRIRKLLAGPIPLVLHKPTSSRLTFRCLYFRVALAASHSIGRVMVPIFKAKKGMTDFAAALYCLCATGNASTNRLPAFNFLFTSFNFCEPQSPLVFRVAL